LLYPKKPTILIVDDDVSILVVFRRIFEKKGFTVTVVEKGKDALEELHKGLFDVALVDFGLPDMEGAELLPVIQKSSPRTLRIMLTGKIYLADQVKCADEFIGKPVNPETLLSVIDTKLRNRDIEET
jgi:DNA-binding response OmpR family regulator